jgi:hypothetical protein
MAATKWGYARIITGTIFGGILGFYVMHRVEENYKVTIRFGKSQLTLLILLF